MPIHFFLLFHLRKTVSYIAGSITIYLRITVGGTRTEFTTGRQCDPEKWNPQSGRAIGKTEDVRSLNAFLDQLQVKTYEAHRHLSERGVDFTAEEIRDRMQGKDRSRRMLIEVFKDHNAKVKALEGKEYSAGTLERYETSLKHTISFLVSKYGIYDIDIRKVDNEFINDYDFFLRSVRNCANNSVVKYIKNFGKIIRICQANGWITGNPFVNYKGRVKTKNRVALTEAELTTMAQTDLASERLRQVRDIFMFCCYTGLAYIDVKKLQNSMIVRGVDGELWIITNRQKTETRAAIPLLPPAIDLIEKYKNYPLCVAKGVPLPVPSNQKVNDYLKEIAEICRIDKVLTSHIARHTFATTVTLSNGVPIESVSKMLGHSSLKQTQHYAKTLDLKVGADMKMLKTKFAGNFSCIDLELNIT